MGFTFNPFTGNFDAVVTDHLKLTNIGSNSHAQIDTHLASTSNPHSVTFAQVASQSGFSFTDHRIIRADGTTALQNSAATIDDTGVAHFPTGGGASSLGIGGNASAANTIVLGETASASFSNSIALGYAAITTATNQFVIGNNGSVTSLRLGGVEQTNPTKISYHGIDAAAGGTDINGGDIEFYTGKSTGRGTGDFVWNSTKDTAAPTAQNTFQERMRLKTNGDLELTAAIKSPTGSLTIRSLANNPTGNLSTPFDFISQNISCTASQVFRFRNNMLTNHTGKWHTEWAGDDISALTTIMVLHKKGDLDIKGTIRAKNGLDTRFYVSWISTQG